VRDIACEAVKVDTFGGTVHVEWDPDAAVTLLGHLAFFAEYLKVSGRFDALVADCPLRYASPNAPSKRDILGTVLLSVLAGPSRYAHITALRGDGVNPSLLGMGKVASEDSVRRGLERIGAEDGASWLQGHLDDTVRPLLSAPWVLDCDTTIKPLYGHQEGSMVSDNPKKPGRPSHACHAFLMAGTRLVLDVDVAPGNHHRSNRAAPSLWALLDRLGRDRWPRLVRGDKNWGSEGTMASCEAAGLDYVFKLRLTKGARRLAERQMARDGWEDAGQGWSGIEAELRLQGWGRSRRVVVLRRRLPGTLALTHHDDGQGDLFWTEARPGTGVWEFAVLATPLDLEVVNAAWLWLSALVRRAACGHEWRWVRMKRIRAVWIHLVARIVRHRRQTILVLGAAGPARLTPARPAQHRDTDPARRRTQPRASKMPVATQPSGKCRPSPSAHASSACRQPRRQPGRPRPPCRSPISGRMKNQLADQGLITD